MAIPFNSDEIFEMAGQMERDASAFYRRAAARATDPDAQALLQELGDWELDHEKLFAMLRRSYDSAVAGSGYDPDDQAKAYLRAIATGITKSMQADADPLAGDVTIRDILNTAIEAEKTAILFYVGVKAMVSPELGQDRVNDIMNEEMRHVIVLTERLETLPEDDD